VTDFVKHNQAERR